MLHALSACLQVPFAGTQTTATCLDGNTDANGLAPSSKAELFCFFGFEKPSEWQGGPPDSVQVWTPPVCTIDTCSDPPDGNGYQRVDGVWESLG